MAIYFQPSSLTRTYSGLDAFKEFLHHLSELGLMAQPLNRRPIHTKSQYLPPISQYIGLEDQNRLEAIYHQKLATDGASPNLTPTHTKNL